MDKYESAIDILENWLLSKDVMDVVGLSLGPAVIEIAIESLREKRQAVHPGRNTEGVEEPLTEDELLKMDGEPIYVIGGETFDYYGDWWIVGVEDGEISLYNHVDEIKPEMAFYGLTEMDNKTIHMLGWKAYRTKPQSGEGGLQ